MTNKEVKQDIIDAIASRGVYFKQVNNNEYRTRCPFCGDSQKDLNTGHFYFHVNLEDNYPIVYNCFKCNESGVFTSDVLTALDINNVDLRSSLTTMNKTSDKLSAHKFLNNTKIVFFDYKRPEINPNDKKIKYIENRLGIKLNEEEISELKIITSFREFLLLNNIKELLCDVNTAKRIEDHFVGFLSYGNSYILFRDISEKDYFRWIKYPITKESKESRLFYSMETELDVFTSEKITVNLTEGVMDIISARFNLGYNNSNTMNLAVCGKRYDTILQYLLSVGIVGNNIVVNIFADNDEKFNKKAKVPTTVNYFKKVLKKYKHLYGEVNIFYNVKDKDIGVKKENIILEKHKI